jgi:hypothetical protein
MSLAAHAAAVLALLYAESRLTVYPKEDGAATVAPPKAKPPYITVHLAGDRPLGGRLRMRSTRVRSRIYVHCTGPDDQGARMVADLVAEVLLDARVVIPGRTCWPIRHQSSPPPREDESTGVLASTLTEVYLLESDAHR